MITGKVNQLCLEASFELIQHARGLVQHHVDTTWNQIQYKLIPSLTGWWSVHRWHGREVEWLLFHISTTTVFHLMFNVVQGTDFAGFQLTHLMCKGTDHRKNIKVLTSNVSFEVLYIMNFTTTAILTFPEVHRQQIFLLTIGVSQQTDVCHAET